MNSLINTSVGFRRLTKHYPSTRVMEKVYKEMEDATIHRNKNVFKRTWEYFWGRKGRYIFLGIVVYCWTQYNFTLKLQKWRERSNAKYRKRWIQKFNPTGVVYTTAMDTQWKPEKLDPVLANKLSKHFCEWDKQSDYGVSRQWILDSFVQIGIYSTEE